MSSFSRLVTLTLGLTAVGCGALAYQQYYLNQAARATIDALEKERTSLRDRVAHLEKARTDRPRWSPTPGSGSSGPVPLAEGAVESGPVPLPRGEGGFNRMRAMMESPQAQQFMAMQQKAGLDSRYAALFRKLNLSPADLDKFKDLLVERQTAIMDVMTAARNQGLDVRSSGQEINQLIRDAQAEVDNSIRSTIGDTAYQEYKDYERTLPMRNTVGQLEQRLSYSGAPLRADQVDQLARILADTNPSRTETRASGAVMFASPDSPVGMQTAMYFGGATINDDALARAQGVLSAPQMEALRQLQQEQQARAQLSQDMRRNINRNATPATGTTSGPVPMPLPAPGGG